MRNKSLLLLSQVGKRIFLPLSTSTRILDASYVIYSSLAACCTSLCNSSSRNTYSFSKSLLIRSRWLVKRRWCLTSTSWTTSTSLPSTSHLHMSNGKLIFNVVSLRQKHSPEILFTYRKHFILYVHAFTSNARQQFNILNQIQQQKFYFRKFYFKTFYFI